MWIHTQEFLPECRWGLDSELPRWVAGQYGAAPEPAVWPGSPWAVPGGVFQGYSLLLSTTAFLVLLSPPDTFPLSLLFPPSQRSVSPRHVSHFFLHTRNQKLKATPTLKHTKPDAALGLWDTVTEHTATMEGPGTHVPANLQSVLQAARVPRPPRGVRKGHTILVLTQSAFRGVGSTLPVQRRSWEKTTGPSAHAKEAPRHTITGSPAPSRRDVEAPSPEDIRAEPPACHSSTSTPRSLVAVFPAMRRPSANSAAPWATGGAPAHSFCPAPAPFFLFSLNKKQ